MQKLIPIFVIVMLVLNMLLFIAAVIKGDTTLMARSMFMWLVFLAVGFIITRKYKKDKSEENKDKNQVISESR